MLRMLVPGAKVQTSQIYAHAPFVNNSEAAAVHI